MRVVSPYRALTTESPSHRKLGAFDWVEALALLRASVDRTCHCETVGLTDLTTELPDPVYRFPARHDRLMCWILEVSLAYLESPLFDQDTVFVSPDSIILRDLRAGFSGDLTVLVRSAARYRLRPILNSVQWWPLHGRSRLIPFYRRALAIAEGLNENLQRWGADSESLRQLLFPISPGLQHRAGLRVSLCEFSPVFISLSGTMMRALEEHKPLPLPPWAKILDFKGPRRKPYMAACGRSLGLTS
jgi:hypothetical protein